MRGHLHDTLGATEAAAAHYRRAAALTTSELERRYLLTRAARLGGRTGGRSADDPKYLVVPTPMSS